MDFSLISGSFWIFFLVTVVIYYLLPGKYQWVYLLVFSVLFFLFSSVSYTVCYLLLTIFFTYYATTLCRNQRESVRKLSLTVGIMGNLSFLVLLKYSPFLIKNIDLFLKVFLGIPAFIKIPEWAAPIGISFYTLSAIGYIVDCYSGVCKPTRNFLKTALFICYWPILTSGPILKYGDLAESMYGQKRELDLNRVCFGIQRMLWGLIKKIVISSRLGIVVDTIYGNTTNYNGLYIWMAASFFVLQLYTDFSGCMDIVLGASECYGIDLPENFRMPLFSKTTQEFWQRWHITLGEWYKNYILFPIMNTGFIRSLEGHIKVMFSRKAGRKVTSYIGMLFVWLFFGLWHGGGWKFVAMGLYFYLIIVFENITHEWFEKLWITLKVPIDTVGWKILRCIKVFIIITIGYMFFRLKNIRTVLTTWILGFRWNPWIFFDESIYKLGLSRKNFNLMIVGLGLLFIVSLYKRETDVRRLVARQPLLVRWVVYITLLFTPIIFGMYGPGYDASKFIYEGF